MDNKTEMINILDIAAKVKNFKPNRIDRFYFQSNSYLEDATKIPLLFRLRDIKYLHVLLSHSYNVAGVICSPEIANDVSMYFPIVSVEKPEDYFWEVHQMLHEECKEPTIIGSNCRIHNSASIDEYGVTIGDGSVIEENVVIREGTIIGRDTYIGTGAVLGGDGFQQYKTFNGIKSIIHNGKLMIGRNVMIKFHTCVDKALFSHLQTNIGDESRIDNLVAIGHAANIGCKTIIAGGASVGGYCHVGDSSFLGMRCTIRPHVSIGANSTIGMCTAIIKDVAENETYFGVPGVRIKS